MDTFPELREEGNPLWITFKLDGPGDGRCLSSGNVQFRRSACTASGFDYDFNGSKPRVFKPAPIDRGGDLGQFLLLLWE